MARGDQVTRQWKIIRMLEASRTGLSVSEIHSQIGEIHVRTIRRDLKDLQNAGFPLFEDDDKWRVLAHGEGGFSIPVDPSELLALLVSEELFEPFGSTEIAGALRELRTKIAATLTPVGRQYVEEVRNTVLATFSAPGHYEARNEDVKIIEEAIQKEHRLDIRYRAPGSNESRRRIDPYTLWFADGRLYVVAWCHLRKDFRTFSVDRIQEVAAVDEAFEPDPTFDARKYTSGGFGVWSGEPEKIVVEFNREIAHLPRERRYHASQKLETLEDGRVRMTMHVAGLANVAAWVASFGGLLVARAPDRLVQMVLEIFALGMYSHTQVSRGPPSSRVRSDE